jgi:hypothetical protein
MAIVFTCAKCDTRAVKAFTRQAYEAGLVLITCPGCQSMHLIADHLGWFGDSAFKVSFSLEKHALEQHALEQHALEQHALEQHALEQHGGEFGSLRYAGPNGARRVFGYDVHAAHVRLWTSVDRLPAAATDTLFCCCCCCWCCCPD